ncbi:hypothetical protein [Rathayibacter soli]|uniref:hypothetical protein n=1 Tax=Rathayibacter soli TaxID=3144168 RepID=UPI0027E41E67|nr:hypothetical protein [Glaciibacter superstes]
MVARIINSVLLFCAGAVFGFIGTVAHQSSVTVAGITIAWGLIVALVGCGCLLAGIRLVTIGRIPALMAALGLLVTITVLSFKSAGGSVLIPDNLAGKIWVIAPVVIAAVVIAWPRVVRVRAGA